VKIVKKRRFNWDNKIIAFIEILIDLSLVLFGMITVLYLSGEYENVSILEALDLLRDLILANGVMLFTVFIFFRVYQTSITKNGFWVVMPKMVLALIMAGIITVFVSIFLPTIEFSKTYFVYITLIQIVYLSIFKYLFYKLYKRFNIKTAIIIGPEVEADSIAAKLLLDKEKYLVLKYIICEEDLKQNQLKTVYEYIDRVDYTYLTPNLKEKRKNSIISYCIDKNKTFYLIPKIFELAIHNAKMDQIGDILSYEVKGLEMSFEDKIIKRIFDILVSIIGIIVTSPILLLMPLIIKIYDKGPVLFKQERLTLDNKKFILYKYRTMIPNAEENTGPILASENDFRITKLGKFMRKSRIDELPQFFNILRGDMSLVGPRPEREYFVEKFTKENADYKYRMVVKAGVTGLAQALGKYNTTFEDKLRFDLYYIRNYSFLKDIGILLHTISAVFDRDSAQGLKKDLSLDEVLNKMDLLMIVNKEMPCFKMIIEK